MATKVLMDRSEFDPLTLAELRLRQATLALEAERLRAVWRGLPSTTTPARSVAVGRQVKLLDARARDYARVLTLMGGAV